MPGPAVPASLRSGRAIALVCSGLWAAGAVALAFVVGAGRGDAPPWVLPPGDVPAARRVSAHGQGLPAEDPGRATGADTSGTPAACEPARRPAAPSEPAAPGILALPPVQSLPAGPTVSPPAGGSSPRRATFRLCGPADQPAARAIEQLIAGQNYRARLIGRPDGCADLSIDVLPSAGGAPPGRQRTQLSISSGGTADSGNAGRRIAVQIASEDGVTHVTIG